MQKPDRAEVQAWMEEAQDRARKHERERNRAHERGDGDARDAHERARVTAMNEAYHLSMYLRALRDRGIS